VVCIYDEASPLQQSGLVFIATREGVVLHWDGAGWEQQDCLPVGINELSGPRRDQLWAAGDDGLVARFDGSGWHQHGPLPEARFEIVTGVRVLDDGRVLACGNKGHVWQGGEEGWSVVGTFPVHFYGLCVVGGRVLLACGQDGVWALDGGEAHQVKDSFVAVGCREIGDRAYFVDGDQARVGPRIIWHDPAADQPWTATSLG